VKRLKSLLYIRLFTWSFSFLSCRSLSAKETCKSKIPCEKNKKSVVHASFHMEFFLHRVLHDVFFYLELYMQSYTQSSVVFYIEFFSVLHIVFLCIYIFFTHIKVHMM